MDIDPYLQNEETDRGYKACQVSTNQWIENLGLEHKFSESQSEAPSTTPYGQ